MKRVNHIIKKGIELKLCSKCGRYLTLDSFHNNNAHWDKLNNYCKKCVSDKGKYTLKDCTNNVWRNLLKRVKKDKNYLKKKIKVNLTETEFKKWYSERWFAGCVLDRIDNERDYEFGNIHIITKAEHNRKQRQDMLKKHNIIEPEGMRYCRNCNQLKPISEFYKKKWRISPYNLLGLDSRCKECNREERKYAYGKKLIEAPGIYYKIMKTEMKVKPYSAFKNKAEAKKEGYKFKRNHFCASIPGSPMGIRMKFQSIEGKNKYITFLELMENPELGEKIKIIPIKEWVKKHRKERIEWENRVRKLLNMPEKNYKGDE